MAATTINKYLSNQIITGKMALEIRIVDDDEQSFPDPKADTTIIERCIEKIKLNTGLADKNNPIYEKCAHCQGLGIYEKNKGPHRCMIFNLIYNSGFVCLVSMENCRYSVVKNSGRYIVH